MGIIGRNIVLRPLGNFLKVNPAPTVDSVFSFIMIAHALVFTSAQP